MTTIYLVRHSEPFKIHCGIEDVKESLLFANIKAPLSVNGEKLAERISNNNEFNNLDIVWSSNYVRAMSTAKYFAYKNNLKVNLSDKLGERIHGINSWNQLPSDFESRQFEDENYKIGNGESQKEVKERLLNFINYLLDKYKNKRILIVGHSTAFAFLLSNWCEVKYTGSYKFNDNTFFDGKWNYCETFKLEFDNNKLISIKNIKFNQKLGGINEKIES